MEHDGDAANDPELPGVLTSIAREAHAARMLPEHLLIGLRVVWRHTRRQHSVGELPDTSWSRVVGVTLDCYERERPA